MRSISLLLVGFAVLLAVGCGTKPATQPTAPAPTAPAADKHDHPVTGPHGGPLAEWGDHQFHAEFTVDHETGTAVVYVLDRNATAAVPIAAKQLTLSLKLNEPTTLTLAPKPQPGDPAGKASAFEGRHEALRTIRRLTGTVGGQFDGSRYSGAFAQAAHGDDQHAEPKTPTGPTPRETELFLTPGGIYTQADVEKNGRAVPSVKFAGASFEHADDLKPGDRVCPITVNKADDNCKWWVNGKEYTFCCPPCLEKFVKQAKQTPEKIKEPGEYIKK